MNTPTPIDPEDLRRLLARAVEPVQPSPDALREIRTGIRKRRLRLSFGTGAGALLLTGGAVAAAVAIGSPGTPQATATLEPGQTTSTTAPESAAPTTTAPAPTTTPAAPIRRLVPAISAGPSAATGVPDLGGPTLDTAAVTSTSGSVITSTPASSPAAPPAVVAHDVDGDGKADTAVTQFIDAKTARLVVHLARRTVTSAPFALLQGMGAGGITFASIGSDGRSEMLVKYAAADGTGDLLFQYAHGQIVEVPAPAGFQEPWLYTGGGGSVQLGFACTAGGLVVSSASPTSMTNFLSGKDKSYSFATTTFQLQGDNLVKTSSHTQTNLTSKTAFALAAAAPGNRCGAAM